MERITAPRTARWMSAIIAAGLLTAAAGDAEAQQLRFSTTAPGGIASTGNTLGLAKAYNDNGPGTEDSIGTFIALDANTVDAEPLNSLNPWAMGTTWDWTLNGSTGVLDVPTGATVIHAELVWAGSYDYYPEDVSASLDLPVTLLANGQNLAVSPDPNTAQTLDEQSYVGFWANYYMRTADVTSFVQQHGATAYTVAGVAATQGTLTNSLSAAGWTLVVAYRHEMQPIRNLTIFVGGSFVDEAATQDYTVTGFCAPPNGKIEGNVVVSSLEGDANLAGDDLAIGATEQGSFVSLSGPNNPESNFFSSQINDSRGLLDTRGSFGDANHDAMNAENIPGARQGWDLTTVALSSDLGHIANDQKSAVLRTQTVGDSYYPVLVAMELDVKSPDFSDSRTTPSVPSVHDGDSFTVTTTLANSGEALADELVLELPLDAGLSLTGFTINTQEGDANGATVNAAALGQGVDAGQLLVGEMHTVELSLEVVGPPENGQNYVFNPRWGHSFTMCSSEAPIDEAFKAPTASVDYEADTSNTDPGPDPDPEVPVQDPTRVNDPVEPASCGCTVPGSEDSPFHAGHALALLGLGAAFARRRRRG
jgi:MYXO-CTERM domain-containing protein